MQFKHPEILYFLFLLVIPILVHLFQLRRFKKEYFTNVRFLKELSIQTRKSSKLKKWLLLATRLFILACIVFAFAQPFFQSKDSKNSTNEMYIVLDNSFSMQAKGQKGELAKKSHSGITGKHSGKSDFFIDYQFRNFLEYRYQIHSKRITKPEIQRFTFSVGKCDGKNKITKNAI